jgi:minichromosome maintenance protein 10
VVLRNLAGSDKFSGCWATAGVVLDKGVARVSSQGTGYSIWKMGALDDTDVSVFLFGDAHTHYSGASVSAVFALFNGNVRMDNEVPFVDLNFDLLIDWVVCYSCVAEC